MEWLRRAKEVLLEEAKLDNKGLMRVYPCLPPSERIAVPKRNSRGRSLGYLLLEAESIKAMQVLYSRGFLAQVVIYNCKPFDLNIEAKQYYKC